MPGAFSIFRRASPWAVAVVLTAACSAGSVAGHDESTPTRAPRPAASAPAAASASAATGTAKAAGQGTIEALLGDHFFDPQVIALRVGMTVTWRNSSGSHNVTARDGSFRSPTLGDSFSYTFTQRGRYPFFCTLHPAEMQGEVVVEPAD